MTIARRMIEKNSKYQIINALKNYDYVESV